MENQIKKKQSKTTNGIQRESKEIQCNTRQSKGFKERKGEKNRLTKAKTSQ